VIFTGIYYGLAHMCQDRGFAAKNIRSHLIKNLIVPTPPKSISQFGTKIFCVRCHGDHVSHNKGALTLDFA